jgi:hypothetical protein
MAKKWLNLILYLFFLLTSTLLLLEACYRFYVVDFYKGSLTGLNSEVDLRPTAALPTMLLFGDSFTADPDSYVKHLRRDISNYRIINAAVSGTTIRQHRLMADRRIKRFKPDILIYQIYLGNDLFEYRHPIRSNKISLMRKGYWWLADHLLVLGYINAKLPQLKALVAEDINPGSGAKLPADFAIDKYNDRIKIQFSAEPELLEHTVLLQKERGDDFHAYVKEVAELLALAPPECKVIVVVIPHCAQLGVPYLERMKSMGAVIDNEAAFLEMEFPFYSALVDTLSADNRYFFNALEYLRDTGQAETLYYENDPHLNPAGQSKLEKALLDFYHRVN